MSIIESMPMLRGVKPVSDFRTNIPLTPTGPTNTLRIPIEEKWKEPGWIKSILTTVSNPYTIIEHNVFEKPTSVTPFILYYLGNWRPPPHGGMWVDRYDAVNSLYTVGYAPVPPQDFKPGTQIILRHPLTDPTGAAIGTINVSTVWWTVILIKNMGELKKSAQELFGGQGGLGSRLGSS